MLAWTIYISFLGVLVLMLLPKGNAAAARKVAMISAVAGLLVAIVSPDSDGHRCPSMKCDS